MKRDNPQSVPRAPILSIAALLAPFLVFFGALEYFEAVNSSSMGSFEGNARGLYNIGRAFLLGSAAGVLLAVLALRARERWPVLAWFALAGYGLPLAGIFLAIVPGVLHGLSDQRSIQQPVAQRQPPVAHPLDRAEPRAAPKAATLHVLPGSGALPSGTLLYSATLAGEIRTLGATGLPLPPLAVGLGGPHDLHLDRAAGVLYTTQWSRSVVRALDLATGTLRAIYEGSGAGGQGIAVDPAAGLLFWGEYYGGLFRGSIDGEASPLRLVSPADLGVCAGGVGMGVEVDPESRLVYFFSRDNCDERGRALWRVDYDGEGLTRLRQLASSDCLTLTPHDGGWLYFSDRRDGRFQLWRSRPDGSEAARLFDLPQPTRPCAGVAIDATAMRLYFLQSSGEPKNQTDLWRSGFSGRQPTRLATDIPGGQALLRVP
jgi:hypothetical protein